jgi:hypothetical protein
MMMICRSLEVTPFVLILLQGILPLYMHVNFFSLLQGGWKYFSSRKPIGLVTHECIFQAFFCLGPFPLSTILVLRTSFPNVSHML